MNGDTLDEWAEHLLAALDLIADLLKFVSTFIALLVIEVLFVIVWMA